MNNIPREIERKILDYYDNYKHMFVCKGWFNVIKEKYNIKEELATTLWKKIEDFKKNLNDNTGIHIATKHPLPRGIDVDFVFTINNILKWLIYKKAIHIYFYTTGYPGADRPLWNYNDYLQFKILRKNVKKILNKVLKYKVRLHCKNYKYIFNEINEFSTFDYFEFIMW